MQVWSGKKKTKPGAPQPAWSNKLSYMCSDDDTRICIHAVLTQACSADLQKVIHNT